jgi:Zn-dependent protease with chaperone function
MEFEGIFYLSGSSHFFTARIQTAAGGTLITHFDEHELVYPPDQYKIESRLGNANRVIHFKDGSRLETSDHDAIAELERQLPSTSFFRLVDWMESRWSAAVAAFVAIILTCYFFLEFGVPAIAEYVAHEIPQSARVSLSNSTLKLIEKHLMKEVESEEAKLTGESAFKRAMQLAGNDQGTKYDYELRIYNAPLIGPNAFALPSGLIVATEQFLTDCETEEQAMAVFLHEIAHVEMQHGLRSVLQDLGIFALGSIVFGDLSSLGGLAASLPTVVMESRYSQKFEKESDAYAAQVLVEHGYGTAPMREVLVLLHKDAPDMEYLQFLSSHPYIKERLEELEAFEPKD